MPDVTISSLDGACFTAYASLPKFNSGPGLMVIHEFFGVNDSMRALCDGYAAQGCIAVCPDLFWRQAPCEPLPDSSEASLAKALARYKEFDVEAGVRDLLATMAHIRTMPGCLGKIGAVGYGLGGKMAWLMAARSDVDCAVSYCGLGLDSMLDELHDIRNPLLIHMAGLDEFTPPAVQQRILATLEHNPEVSACVYPDAGHAFARPAGLAYRPDTALQANERTATFLAQHLQ
jgi:carboxymethylenebutenolidase